ncbi:uncharacterized protein LOC106168950 [Lingula anatina]|uniref:Uncharacterized protein LOC106168950 n=1 Tax=Lingula anatina TaxID=7574 RepID=A0A1S3J1H0_LINAN|nr:uncharacterized protein LOC106168950 [Lingula anatina]|eukprot:XP_013403664.1 uncharacterized protein LOC106168950 [Lingula anatina]
MADPTTPAPQTDQGILILAYIAGVAGLILVLFCVCFWVRRIRWRPGRKYLKEQKERQVAMQAALTGQPLRYKNGHPKVITVKEQEKVKKKEAKKNMVKVTVHDIKMERLQRRKGINTSPLNGKSHNGKAVSSSMDLNGRHSNAANGDVVDEPYGSIPAIKRSQAFYGSVSSLELPSLAPIHEGMHSPKQQTRENLQLEEHDEDDVTNHVVECDVHVSARRHNSHDNNSVPDIVVHRDQEIEIINDVDEHPAKLGVKMDEDTDGAKSEKPIETPREKKAKSPLKNNSSDAIAGKKEETNSETIVSKSRSAGNLQTDSDTTKVSNAQVMEKMKSESAAELRSRTPRKKSPRNKTELTENQDVAIVTTRKKKTKSPRSVQSDGVTDSVDFNAMDMSENSQVKRVRKKKSPRPEQGTEAEERSVVNSKATNDGETSSKPRKKKAPTPRNTEAGEDNPSFVEEV